MNLTYQLFVACITRYIVPCSFIAMISDICPAIFTKFGCLHRRSILYLGSHYPLKLNQSLSLLATVRVLSVNFKFVTFQDVSKCNAFTLTCYFFEDFYTSCNSACNLLSTISMFISIYGFTCAI